MRVEVLDQKHELPFVANIRIADEKTIGSARTSGVLRLNMPENIAAVIRGFNAREKRTVRPAGQAAGIQGQGRAASVQPQIQQ